MWNQTLHKFHEDGNSLVYMDPNDLCFAVEEFNYEGLCRAIEQLSDFKKRANSRVIKSGVLKGLNLEDIKRAGEHLILQDGCKGDLRVRNVHSNELAYEDFITTGDIIKKVESPLEKLQAFSDYTKGDNEISKHSTIYIGGSVGDLLCLEILVTGLFSGLGVAVQVTLNISSMDATNIIQDPSHGALSSGLSVRSKNAQVEVIVVSFPLHSHLDQLLRLSCLIAAHNIPVHYATSATHLRQAKLRFGSQTHFQNSKIHFHEFPTPHFLSLPPIPNSSSKFPSHLQPSFEASVHLCEPAAALLREVSAAARRVVVIHQNSVQVLLGEELKGIPSLEGCSTPEFQNLISLQYDFLSLAAGILSSTHAGQLKVLLNKLYVSLAENFYKKK
ncbi:hypothetical protein RHGRI_010534 [Rhododendron griersonianum]|uniref:Glycosyltransferase N-terminal domain-containing protein n=1 Tax=Rhododendron griersonianum TaxID=479676 RepID=A0AAV6KJ33_9ERIC|nr:hypothetical protein RHGRI_010534 [Rhododendron griersonianum]